MKIWKLLWWSTRKFNRVAQQVEENWSPHSQKWSAWTSLHFRRTTDRTMCCGSLLCWCQHLFIEARCGDEMNSVHPAAHNLGGYLSINAQWLGPAMARASLITPTSRVLLYGLRKAVIWSLLFLFFGNGFPSWKEREGLDRIFCFFCSPYTALFLIGFIYPC